LTSAYISDNIVNTELLVEVARALGIPDWSPDEYVCNNLLIGISALVMTSSATLN
jgi:hypothetical protein